MSALDHREKGGYERLELPIFFDDRSSVIGITYFAGPANPNYLGEASVRDIAKQVISAAGPSGPNIEYVLQLENALSEMGAFDEHVSEVATMTRELSRHEA